MTQHRLRRTDRHPAGMAPKRHLQGCGLISVVLRSRAAMGVDIVNFLRVETGDIESIFQSVSQCDSISRKPGHVVSIAETGKTQNIAQDFGARSEEHTSELQS